MYNAPYMEKFKEASVATVNQLGAGIAWEKPADLSSRDVQKRLGPSAVKAFMKIREHWNCAMKTRGNCSEACPMVHFTS